MHPGPGVELGTFYDLAEIVYNYCTFSFLRLDRLVGAETLLLP